jgi:hypothetical protein
MLTMLITPKMSTTPTMPTILTMLNIYSNTKATLKEAIFPSTSLLRHLYYIYTQ